MKLKVLSYNIHKGFTTWNSRYVLDRIRLALRETDADILFLQEVLGHREGLHLRWKDSETRAQFEYLADEVWTHFAYGQNAVYSEGHHGNAILSKFPITEWSNETLPSGNREGRGVLKAKIFLPHLRQEMILANTHLDLTQRGREDQARALIDSMTSHSELPWLMVGDFNDWNGKISLVLEKGLHAREAFKTLYGKYPRTFPSFFPLLSLDRLFLHKLNPLKALVLNDVQWKGLSDHSPLYVEVGGL